MELCHRIKVDMTEAFLLCSDINILRNYRGRGLAGVRDTQKGLVGAGG